MTTLRRRRNALLLMRLVELSAHGSLQFALVMHLSSVTKLSLEERALALGVIAAGELVAYILGGIVADRWLGYRRAVLGGAGLVVLGYVVSSLDQWLTVGAGLALLTIGRGLHGHALPALLGDLRAPRDPRRDMDFLLLGFTPILGGIPTIALMVLPGLDHWSARMLFGAAIVGAGAIVVARAYPARPLGDQGTTPSPPSEVKRARVSLLVVLALGLRLFATGLPLLLGVFLEGRLQAVEARSLSRAQLILPTLLGILSPLLLLGIFAAFRPRREERPLPDKMGLGMLLTVASFAILLLGARVGGAAGPASAPWLVLFNVTSSVGLWLMSSMSLSLALASLSPRWKATLIGLFWSDSVSAGVLGGSPVVLTSWPSVPGLGLVVALSLGATLLWRARGLGLVEAAQPASSDARAGDVVT